MFRSVYDLLLKGLPEEVSCIAKLGEYLFSRGLCVGSHTTFLCSYKGSLVKLAPQVIKPQYPTYEVPQVGTIRVVVESESQEALMEVVSDIYKLLRDCGITLRLLPE